MAANKEQDLPYERFPYDAIGKKRYYDYQRTNIYLERSFNIRGVVEKASAFYVRLEEFD